MLLLIGPAVAVIGIVAVVFVMRHKAVEKRSMYSARRSQIEHKVRAARQRTLAPGRRADKADKGHAFEETAAAAPTMTYEATAYASPPVAPPPPKSHSAPAQSAWDSGPVSTPVDTPAYTPPAYTPPAATPTPPAAAPAYEPPPFEAPAARPEWTPAPPTQAEPEPAARPAEPASTSAGAGASWSVVGESKGIAEPEPAHKKKGSKDAQTGVWSLASGEAAGDEADEGPKKPSAVIAIAQYALLVVGLVTVLIGVVVTVANSHGT
ncbi:MAG TPA: hypothetical protein VIO80_12375 [Candidatus Dormibacteraeota bacterium]